MVLFHPVPAFIAVLPVLFSLDELSVVSAEESHLSKKEGKEMSDSSEVYRYTDQAAGQDEYSSIIMLFQIALQGVVV